MYPRLSIALGTLCVCALTGALVQAGEARTSAKPRTDRYGDSLPEGARFRLGTLRFHYPEDFASRPSMAFIDDKTLVSLNQSGLIVHWDPVTGKHLKHLRAPRTETSTMPSLSENGRVAAFIQSGPTISVRDTTSGRELRQFPASDFGLPCLSPDGSLLASWDSRSGVPFGDLLIWEVASKNPPRHLKCPTSMHSPRVYIPAQVYFSADNKSVFYVSKDAFLYDVATGWQKLRYQPKSGSTCAAVAMSPDGKTLAIVERPPVLVLLDASTGKEKQRVDFPEAISNLAFSRDGSLLALELYRSVKLCETRTWSVVSTLESSSSGLRLPLALTPNGKMLARPGHGDESGVLQIWDTSTSKRSAVPNPSGAPRFIAFAPDGKTLLATHGVGYSRWDTASGQLSSSNPRTNFGSPACFMTDGTLLAGGRSCLTRWDPTAEKLLAKFAYAPVASGEENKEHIDLVACSPDGKLFLARSIGEGKRVWRADGTDEEDIPLTIRAWDARTRALVVQYKVKPGYCVDHDALSPDARLYLTSQGDLYEAATGHRLLSLEGPEPVQCDGYCFSSNAGTAAALAYRGVQSRSAHGLAYHGGDVVVWEIATGTPALYVQRSGTSLGRVALSPNGRVVAMADDDAIRLLDVGTGKQVWERHGHDSPVCALVFSLDGRTLATGLADSTILFWDVGDVVVRTPHRLSQRQMDALWSDLAQPEARKGQAAVQQLADADENAASFLKGRVKAAEEVSAKRLQDFIADLDSDNFQKRQRAVRELAAVSELAEPAMRAALKQKRSAEASGRMEELLKNPGRVSSPNVLQAIRAIQALELIGSQHARAVLAILAAGAPAARETREAKAALDRLAHRPQ